MNRRGFLRGVLAAGVAPYVVTAAGVLMPVKRLALPDPFAGYVAITEELLTVSAISIEAMVRADLAAAIADLCDARVLSHQKRYPPIIGVRG